ncbi:MAG: hydrogenase [Lentisphaerae bacterium RIFOXYB12_FULL_65_16]|nr:MAG: hydrogenase [Lentisphaerae bacterium RIFOXYA12_64_32]OGV88926.1 MAG: hydrogenase [Lentisphaerae bacterium RIFOXYB12_FULL_65_16]
MTEPKPKSIRNLEPLGLDKVPVLDVSGFRRTIVDAVRNGARVSSFFGVPASALAEGNAATPAPDGAASPVRLFAVLASVETGTLSVLSALVQGEYPSLTPECPQVHWFEREIWEQWSVKPAGHPWLKPIRFHAPYAPTGSGAAAGAEIGVAEFFRIEGAEVHEVAVGPVHAGVIEPGHFRFQCHGENVYHLEISLGYQHRGVEPALVGGPNRRTLHYLETLAGDTSVGHATAYARLVEALAGAAAPPRAMSLRGIALELERLANHTGDLGALAGDVAYLPTASYCGRLRGDFLNLSALLCGNRFGRGLIVPGGVNFDADRELIAELQARLAAAAADVQGAVELLWQTPSVMARFENTGALSLELATELGLVGPVARACGARMDVRHDFPAGIYQFVQVPMSTWNTGDVFARAYVRWLEIQKSIAFIQERAEALPDGACRQDLPVAPDRRQFAVSLVEGWRGEICHVAITNSAGRFIRYKIVDPSFHNWIGLAMALRGQPISDFPLCNKSFNLSYCGHDL